MALAASQVAAQMVALRQKLYRVSDPDIAERVLTLAVARQSMAAKEAMPWLEGERDRAGERAHPHVEHLAHDLCILLTFLGPDDDGRAKELAGSGLWRLVDRMGGWARLHAVPRHYRRRHLREHLSRLRGPGLPLADVPSPQPPQVSSRSRVGELLAIYQRACPALRKLDVFDLVAHPLTLGALDFLLARLSAVAEEWDAERVRRAWYILVAKCPTARER